MYLSLKRTLSSLRTLSNFSAVPSTPKRKKHHPKVAYLSKPLASRPKSLKDLIAISRQLFQSVSHQSNLRSSVAKNNGKDGSSLTTCQLKPAGRHCIAENNKKALEQKTAYNERVRMDHVSHEREAKVVRTTAISAQPSKSIMFSRAVTFMGTTHQLCKACGEISTLQ